MCPLPWLSFPVYTTSAPLAFVVCVFCPFAPLVCFPASLWIYFTWLFDSWTSLPANKGVFSASSTRLHVGLKFKKISPTSFSSSFLVAMVIAHSTAICFMTARNHLHKVRSFLTPPFKIYFYCRYSDEVWLSFTYFTFITRPQVFLSLSNIHTHKFIQKAYTHHQITHLQHTEYKIETLCTAVVAWQYAELCSRNKHKHHRIYVEKYLL